MNLPVRPLAAPINSPKPSAAILPLRPSVAKSRLPSTVIRYAGAVASRVLPPLLTLVVIVGIWQILCSHPGASLPAPSKIVSSSWELISNPFYDRGNMDKGLFWHLLSSLKRVAFGFTLAATVGIALGVLIGQSVIAHRGLDPIFQVLRTVPPLAWLPLSLAAFRHAEPSAIFVIFITAVWPIVINTAVGVQNIPQDYRNVARVLRLNGFEYFWRIMLPASVPYIFTGLKIGVGLSWLAIVAAEMLIGGVGIGFFIWDAWNSSLISDIIVALIYVGLVGYMLDRMIATLGYFVSRGTVAK